MQNLEFSLQQLQVKFAYLFGSHVTTSTPALSDVDIALSFNPRLSDDEQFARRLEYIQLITRTLRRDDIDVGDLNRCDTDLVFEVLRDGELFFCPDREFLITFKQNFTRQCLDFAYYKDRHLEEVLNRLKTGKEPHGREKKYQEAIREIRRRFGAAEADTK